jgi:phosphoribosyl-ATP pyrophosphohydrolase
MKQFETLFSELAAKIASQDLGSGTVTEFNKGKHFIGKKIVEEASEVWMAAEYEGRERTAEEISQLLYHLQVMMLACDLSLDDIYKYL